MNYITQRCRKVGPAWLYKFSLDTCLLRSQAEVDIKFKVGADNGWFLITLTYLYWQIICKTCVKIQSPYQAIQCFIYDIMKGNISSVYFSPSTTVDTAYVAIFSDLLTKCPVCLSISLLYITFCYRLIILFVFFFRHLIWKNYPKICNAQVDVMSHRDM